MVRPRTRLPRSLALVGAFAASFALVGCRTEAVPEPSGNAPAPEKPADKTPAASTTTTQATPPSSATPAVRGRPGSSPDPLGGKFTLVDATKDLPGTGPLVAAIDTSMGTVTCKLYDDKAPNTVANFIGLATGKRSWLDPNSGTWVNKPAYDGTIFHRIIKGFMIQGGDPKGNGSGEPGYVVADEMWPGATHDRAGLLCMANRGPNTNGAQFFITESDGPSVKGLDHYNTYTIFGDCTPVSAIHTIGAVPTAPGDRPLTPVTINSVRVSRQGR